MSTESGVPGEPRFPGFGEELIEEIQITLGLRGAYRVITGIVPDTGGAKVGPGTPLEKEVPQRSFDAIRSAGAPLVDRLLTAGFIFGGARKNHAG